MRIIDDTYSLPDKPLEPQIGADVYIAPGAVIVGRVVLGDGASVWPGTVLRGDIAPIEIGRMTNLQDGVIIHVANSKPCIVGEEVTVGHRAVLHACRVGDGCLIGIGAIILDNSEIGEESLIAAGTLVTPGTRVPPGSLVMGSPGKVLRELKPEERAQGRKIAKKYHLLAKAHQEGHYRKL